MAAGVFWGKFYGGSAWQLRHVPLEALLLYSRNLGAREAAK